MKEFVTKIESNLQNGKGKTITKITELAIIAFMSYYVLTNLTESIEKHNDAYSKGNEKIIEAIHENNKILELLRLELRLR